MSSQNNGKKNGSGNTSLNNTPSSTPNAITSNPANQAMHNANSPNNAPKYGTLVPNRIFVGGISANTTEAELLDLFSKHGTVKAAKIIQDRAGVSKGYGFITFETEEEARRIQRESDIILKERRLNIAPAIKKQPFSRTYESTSPPSINSAPAQYYLPANGLPLFSTGVTYYPQPPPPPPPPGDPNNQQTVYQTQAVYQPPTGPPQTASYPPMVYPTQQIYMPQQFPFPTVPYDYGYFPNGNTAQFVVGNQGAPQHQQPPMQPPGSPTRTSCFNPQLQYGPDTVFFNMPMYGTVEGTPMYSDAMDMNNGNMSEDQPPNVCVSNQETQAIAYQPTDIPPPLPPQSSHHNYASSQSNQSCNYTESTETANLVINNRQEENFMRSSATPVVSLLTLEQQQERDFRSMQSGRRQKAVEGGGLVMIDVNSCNTYTSGHERPNDYTNHGVSQNMIPTAPPPNIEQMQYAVPPPQLPHDISRANSNQHPERYNYKNYNNKNTDRYNNNFYYQEQSQSSFNKNQYEERLKNNNAVSESFTNSRRNNYSGSSRRGGGFNNNQSNFRRSQYFHNNEYRQRNNNGEYAPRNNNSQVNNHKGNQGFPASKSSITSTESFHVVDQQTAVVTASSNTNGLNNNSTLIPPQIPIPLSSGGNQNFIPPARKNRRSVRRNPHSGPPLSEIGAGDAPLPSSEVSDACKKLDNLKL